MWRHLQRRWNALNSHPDHRLNLRTKSFHGKLELFTLPQRVQSPQRNLLRCEPVRSSCATLRLTVSAPVNLAAFAPRTTRLSAFAHCFGVVYPRAASISRPAVQQPECMHVTLLRDRLSEFMDALSPNLWKSDTVASNEKALVQLREGVTKCADILRPCTLRRRAQTVADIARAVTMLGRLLDECAAMPEEWRKHRFNARVLSYSCSGHNGTQEHWLAEMAEATTSADVGVHLERLASLVRVERDYGDHVRLSITGCILLSH